MLLNNHFHPLLSIWRPWKGFHGDWATAIAFHLNQGRLPDDYYALPLLEIAGRVEVDVATFAEREPNGAGTPERAAAPQPLLTLPLAPTAADAFEVQVFRQFGGSQLHAAIELVRPANKDHPSSRRAFANKCIGYLQRGMSVVMEDVVTDRSANLHSKVVSRLKQSSNTIWESETGRYAIANRRIEDTASARLEAWPQALTIGQPLPELPL